MPWMLIRQRPSEATSADTSRPETTGEAEGAVAPTASSGRDDQNPAQPSPPRERPVLPTEPARDLETQEQGESHPEGGKPFEVWIMHGNPARSLFQAGACRALADDHGLPGSLYAGGFSSINAVLLAAGGGRALSRGWERLRAQRLLFDEGLRDIALLRAFAASSRRTGQLLAHELARLDLANSPIGLHLSAGDFDLGTNGSIADPQRLQRLAEATLAGVSEGRQAWLEAIDAALTEGATHVLLVGVDAEPDSPLLESATSLANSAGVELGYIRYQTRESPRSIDFLLPGSGVPERLIADGVRAARSWLKEQERRHSRAER